METEQMRVILDACDEDGNPVECGDCGAVIGMLVIPANMTLSEALDRFDFQCDDCASGGS